MKQFPDYGINPDIPDADADETLALRTARRIRLKLQAKAAEGCNGWHRPYECSRDSLTNSLLEHMDRVLDGDNEQLIDVVILAAMLLDRNLPRPPWAKDGYGVWTDEYEYIIARNPQEAMVMSAARSKEPVDDFGPPEAWERNEDDALIHMIFPSVRALRAHPIPVGALVNEWDEDGTAMVSPGIAATAKAWVQCMGPGWLLTGE